ncbi:hypothetical protein SYNPS1DRAFT_16196 [Syncephalis pseudoplumigaleata]|uniref:Eukaryotic translation initiation factor 3 subunit M n=1 Tax=Syncephalis pseudoplumigaleata TaxID=1712513 RepID=A0A4P9YZN0_9FUNG|nr:hypothetical protein SYNPS1DRAFT_16196 [Syncephalis pseudoplumigaleata]|eukprot:RKP25062.1 hypothetical protein SYNPS1DRAFT_16196 [Syncephalis pseudoplumigaleata]
MLDLETSFNLVLAVLANAKEEQIDAFVTRVLVFVDEDDVERVALKLKVLSNLFNALQASSSLRARVFQSIVRLAERAGVMSAIAPQLGHLDGWMAEWSLDAEQRSELYLQLGLAFKAGGQLEQAFDMRRKYLHTIPEASWAGAKDQIVSVIADAIQSPGFFAFEELASIPSVQQLNKEPAGQLLNVLVDSSVAEYRAFIRANGDALALLGLSGEDVLRKMRILTLATIGAERLGAEVPYTDIAKALDIDVDEVEIWVIDVIRAGMISARLNQLKQTVVINRSSYRLFGQREWQMLGDRLHAWQQSLTSVLETVSNARASTQSAV